MTGEVWAKMSNTEKALHIVNTPVGRVPCPNDVVSCVSCPIGKFERCNDDVSHKRASAWLKKNGVNK